MSIVVVIAGYAANDPQPAKSRVRVTIWCDMAHTEAATPHDSALPP